MNAQSKQILESAGLKNPKDIAMVEAIAASQRSPLMLGIVVGSLALNLVLALLLFRATQGLSDAETRLTAAANNASAATAAIAKDNAATSSALAKAAELNQNAANTILTNVQSLPALVSSLNETARAMDRSESALKVTLEKAAADAANRTK